MSRTLDYSPTEGVGGELSEKLMKELADPSSRLEIPRPKKQP